MELLDRLAKSIRHARDSAPILGWNWILREKYLRRKGIKEVQFHPDGLEYPVWCRVVSSDIYEYTHLLGRGKAPFNLPIVPDYIVDAGSNVGYSVLRFHSDYPNARIIAIEPEHKNVLQLKKNCSFYPSIAIEQAALWSHSTRISIKSLDVAQNAFQVEEDGTSDIEALSVEDVMRRHDMPYIDLLKIDIEGSEKVVFTATNAKDWLRHVRMIMIETHDRFEMGCTEAVEDATKEGFYFSGIFGEYRIYLSKNL